MLRYSNLQRFVSNFENLEVHFFVIGYKNLGESCLVLYVDKGKSDKVIFSMVIDSYVQNKKNITRKLLKKYNVENIDIVCWTHPHHDHSLGLDDLIKEFGSEKIVFIRPDFYYGNPERGLLKNECNKTIDIFSNILKTVHKDNLIPIKSLGGSNNTFLIDLISEDDGKMKESDLYFLTPNISNLDWKAIYKEAYSNPNDLSVSFVLSLDGYMFYFGGDVENCNINGCNKKLLGDVRWVKVPHHCSDSSDDLVYFLGNSVDYAASTVFYKHNLPNEMVQKMYANKTTLFMTQKRMNDEKKFGVVEFIYKFGIDGITVDVSTYGNAYKYE